MEKIKANLDLEWEDAISFYYGDGDGITMSKERLAELLIQEKIKVKNDREHKEVEEVIFGLQSRLPLRFQIKKEELLLINLVLDNEKLSVEEQWRLCNSIERLGESVSKIFEKLEIK